MKRAFYRFFLLNKRLYKKPIFLIILALIPLLMFSFGIVAQDDSGLVRIALARTDKGDELAGEIITELTNRDGLMYFSESTSLEDAINMVKTGKADAAWIFPADTRAKTDAFVQSPGESNYIVEVYQREQTIPLRLSGELLSNEFFRYCSRSMFINYVRERVPELGHLPDDELYKYYDEFEKNAKLFDFTETNTSINSKNFLLTPMRGLLSVIVLLCGLAATLFFIQDKQSGTFSLIPEEKLPMTGFICQLIAVLNVGIVILVSLFISGLSVSFSREIPILILFCISCASFCSLLHLIIKEIKLFGALLPLLIIVSITVCPVFFDFGSVRYFQLLLPPTYYINAAYDNTELIYLVLYCGISTGLFLLLSKLRFIRMRGAK